MGKETGFLSLHEPAPLDPAVGGKWWEENAPEAIYTWGKPVLHGGAYNVNSLAMSLPEIAGTGIVYDGRSWWYMDMIFDAYLETSERRIEALYRRMVILSCDICPTRSLRQVTIPLIDLSGDVLKAAKELLKVGPQFWERNHRIVNGVREQMAPLATIEEFVTHHVEEAVKEPLPLFQAYERYVLFCQESGTRPLEKTPFRDAFGAEISKRYGLRMRNDLKVGSKTTRGWKQVTLKSWEN